MYKNRAKTTKILGKNCSFETLDLLSTLPHLGQLFEALENSEGKSPRFPRPLGTDEIEMIEAELRNQGIITSGPKKELLLSERLAREAALWKWRARSASPKQLRFLVDVPCYIAHFALELSEQSELKLGEGSGEDKNGPKLLNPLESQVIESKAGLEYLNEFASYVNGTYDKHSNRFEQGLNVVLRALSRGNIGHSKQDSTTTEIILPVSKKKFFSQIKSTPENLNELSL